MKAVVVSDTHNYQHKGRQDRLDDCLDVLKWVGNTALDRGINRVFHLGDMLHEKARIHVRAYQATFEIIRDFARRGVEWWLLLGNHDMMAVNDWEVNSISPFSAIEGVHVITEPTRMELGGRGIDWMPYCLDPVRHADRWKDREGRLLLGHISIDEAQHNLYHSYCTDLPVENEADMPRVPAGCFAGYDKVLLGHIHLPQILGNIEYIGSPLELRADEAEQDKHIGVIDLDDLSMEYIPNDFSPKHIRVRMDEIEGRDLNGHFVTVLVDDPGTVDVFEIERRLQGTFMLRRLDITAIPRGEDDPAPPTDGLEEKFSMADGDAVRRYVEATGPGNLDKDRIVSVGLEFCTDA